MKKIHFQSFLAMFIAASSLAAPYSYSGIELRDLSANNFNEVNFKKANDHILILSKDQVKVGDTIMVHDRFQRTYTMDEEGKLVVGRSLGRLDRIKVLDNSSNAPKGKIKVKVLSSIDRRLSGVEVFVNIDGLSLYEDHKEFDSDVYVVQNIATEKLRIYERVCKDNSCPPRILLETDFVAGLKNGDDDYGKRTRVGSYRIFEWHKFYQDRNGGHYPSWYDPKFPDVPGPNESWSKWFKNDVMPWDAGKDMMRGAFGWYTALVEPNYSTEQWMHGTIGWGESSEENILRAKGEDFWGGFASMFTSLRSSGCSRVSNPAIAFMKHILPVGTPLIRIYALEKYQDEASMKKTYKKNQKFSWDYILTKDGVREINDKATSAHKNFVEERNLDAGDYLEEDRYEFTNYPRVSQIQDEKGRKCRDSDKDNLIMSEDERTSRNQILVSDLKKIKSKSCNLYKIPVDAFEGVFYVDTGLVKDYKHPETEGVLKGGFNSEFLPAYMDIKNYK